MKVRRVFLLGAGASKSWGLPLTNELFPLALTKVPKRQTRTMIRDFIKYQYPHFARRWKNYPPFEEFLSLVDVYLEFADVIKKGHSFSTSDVACIQKRIAFGDFGCLAKSPCQTPNVRGWQSSLNC